MEFAPLIRSPRVEKVIVHRPFNKPKEGTICITGHHLFFSTGNRENEDELWVVLRNIDAVEKKPNQYSGGILVVYCKDFYVFKLDVAGTEDFNNVAYSLETLSSLEDQTLFYPFFYQPQFPMIEDGWTAFQPQSEYSQLLQSDEWRISYVNSNYDVCGSYSSAVIVPKAIDDDTLIAAAAFRQGGRFPVLAYRHEGNAVILRSSQPGTGSNVKRCKEDERLLNSVLKPGMRGYIVDTRSQSSNPTSKAKTGGFEIESHYPQWKRIQKQIEKRNALLDSLSKLVEACSEQGLSMDKWLSRLESSQWLSHVKETLNCACLVAQCIDQESAAVLLHGAEGLDSTLAVSSLAQIILSPDCRTVRGFEALIEREWIQGGYPFVKRHQHSAFSNPAFRTKENSPTFLLFIDCAWQILQQFPCSFEFTEDFLLQLARHSYCSQFGTFLGNCEAERKSLKLQDKTVSLWSYMNQPEVLRSHLNPMYEPNNRVIWPSVAPMSLTLWPGLYLAYFTDATPRKDAWKEMNQLFDKDKELRSKAARLRRQLADLQREAMEKSILTE